MYAWASPDYLLKHMSLEQIFMYYDYGIEHEENKATILTNRIAVGFFGAEEETKPKRVDNNPTPDRKAFYDRYGDKIKRPEVNEVKP